MALHGPEQCPISLPGLNGLVVQALLRCWHLLPGLVWPPSKGIWRGLRGGGVGDQVIHQPHRFWMTWHPAARQQEKGYSLQRGEREGDTGRDT